MKKLLFSIALVASTMMVLATDGALPGRFTINANGDQVIFSQGNLQYQPSTQTYRFAEHQWDFIGDATNGNVYEEGIKSNNAIVNASYSGWMDLFGWGVGDNPLRISSDEDYDIFTDLGRNQISNGGNDENIWYTMDKENWLYILFRRPNASNLFDLGNVHGVNGMIILPDNWIAPEGVSFIPSTISGLNCNTDEYCLNSGGNFSHNIISDENWSRMEENGAIFLPASGYRWGIQTQHAGQWDMFYAGIFANYQVSTIYSWPGSVDGTYWLTFGEQDVRFQGSSGSKSHGASVRLVMNVPDETLIMNEDPINLGEYYSTFYHSMNSRLPNDGTEAYVAKKDDDKLIMTKIAENDDEISGDVAYILKSPNDHITLTLSEGTNGITPNPSDNDLVGTNTVTALSDIGLDRNHVYVLSGTSTYGVGFYHPNSDNLKAHRAYVPISGASPVPRLRFVFNEGQVATDIQDAETSKYCAQKTLHDGRLIIIRNGIEYNSLGQLIH